MHTLVKALCDAKLALLQNPRKGHGLRQFDPKKPRAVRVYVATRLPE